MFERLFLDHPHSVGESYFEHLGVASSFAIELFVAALACAVHALVPGLCVRTGSQAITRLHGRMVTNRVRNPAVAAPAQPAAAMLTSWDCAAL
jgi:hypothetical protein